MSDRIRKTGKKDWVDRQLEDPEFRRGFEQELVSQRFGDALQSALERQGITRSDLAKRLGKTRSAVTQVLRHGRNLTIKKMVELASAIGYEIEIELRPSCGWNQEERAKTAIGYVHAARNVNCTMIYWQTEGEVEIGSMSADWYFAPSVNVGQLGNPKDPNIEAGWIPAMTRLVAEGDDDKTSADMSEMSLSS